MNYSQLDQFDPELNQARHTLRSQVQGFAAMLGDPVPFADDDKMTFEGVMLLRCFAHVELIESNVNAPLENENWTDLGVFMFKGAPVRAFLSRNGDLVHVADALCRALMSGNPVDAAIAQHQSDRRNVIVAVTNQQIVLPKSLLLQLRPPTKASSHPKSHPSENR